MWFNFWKMLKRMYDDEWCRNNMIRYQSSLREGPETCHYLAEISCLKVCHETIHLAMQDVPKLVIMWYLHKHLVVIISFRWRVFYRNLTTPLTPIDTLNSLNSLHFKLNLTAEWYKEHFYSRSNQNERTNQLHFFYIFSIKANTNCK